MEPVEPLEEAPPELELPPLPPPPDVDKAKVAVTLWSAPIVTSQDPVPPHPPPDHPLKVEPALGVAVSVTTSPSGYS